jgi:CDP-paratose 2-epimerase
LRETRSRAGSWVWAAGTRSSGFDNFIRPGSESNRAELKRLGVKLIHADVRAASDVDSLPPATG